MRGDLSDIVLHNAEKKRFEIRFDEVANIRYDKVGVKGTIRVPDSARLTSFTEWSAHWYFYLDPAQLDEAVLEARAEEARVAAEAEAARVAAEQARIAVEQEAARVAAELEATRVAAEL